MRFKKYGNHIKVRLTLRVWFVRLAVEYEVPRDRD